MKNPLAEQVEPARSRETVRSSWTARNHRSRQVWHGCAEW